MRAVVCTNAELEVVDRPEPEPGRGQVRLEVLRCGICGSDLHARHGIDEWADLAARAGYDRFGRSDEPIVFGHEFCGEVAEYGPKCARATSRPGRRSSRCRCCAAASGVDTVGLSVHAPGAYAEQVLVEESLMLPVPNGLAPDVAALTEPMAVAWHAVRRGEVGKRHVAIVIGCGPVGLGVILMLKAKGVRTVVASDFSPGPPRAGDGLRRRRRRRPGADASPFTARGRRTGHLTRHPVGARAGRRHDREARARCPSAGGTRGGWPRRSAPMPKHPVIFECVGVPGVIESIIDGAPLFSRVVVVGVCVGTDQFTPAMAINKEIDLRFVVGYTPLEFRDTLHMLADGKVDPRPLITGDGRARRRRRRLRRARRSRDPREDPHRPAERRNEPGALAAVSARQVPKLVEQAAGAAEQLAAVLDQRHRLVDREARRDRP